MELARVTEVPSDFDNLDAIQGAGIIALMFGIGIFPIVIIGAPIVATLAGAGIASTAAISVGAFLVSPYIAEGVGMSVGMSVYGIIKGKNTVENWWWSSSAIVNVSINATIEHLLNTFPSWYKQIESEFTANLQESVTLLESTLQEKSDDLVAS